ncbi:MAG: SH3 domain-containing protein [Anaerolineales bacterium]|nr:SH3 domain-containing protein [Anaerolineales bacterium]
MKRFLAIVWLAMFCAGCSFSVDVIEAETPTVIVVTSTLPPSPTSQPSETPLPPLPTGTVAPVAGTTSTQVNVRAQPSTASETLGVIPANLNVEITGKDPAGNWYQINYPAGQTADGKGWVTAQFITTSEEPNVPVIGAGAVAIVGQQINVRSGPGTNFNALGTLNAKDVAVLTGKDSAGVWLQIEFAAGPEGKGWINSAFVQATGVETLPIVSSSNEVVGTETPTNAPTASTPAALPAPNDGDSPSAPAVNVTLSATGTKSFQYSSDVSSPVGDAEDWIQFTPSGGGVLLQLECEGSGSYVAEVLFNEVVIQTLVCGKIILVPTLPNTVYAIRFQSAPMGDQQYTRFTVTVTLTP